ncbi:hypothetical protein GCM10023318_58970 [Nocardia callitridis]|uniref:Uncharacterized protein n=1 Tax=Nocardia callitridis TaxID=648753 RepID=A0ABP9KZQ0_9NOCA
MSDAELSDTESSDTDLSLGPASVLDVMGSLLRGGSNIRAEGARGWLALGGVSEPVDVGIGSIQDRVPLSYR